MDYDMWAKEHSYFQKSKVSFTLLSDFYLRVCKLNIYRKMGPFRRKTEASDTGFLFLFTLLQLFVI